MPAERGGSLGWRDYFIARIHPETVGCSAEESTEWMTHLAKQGRRVSDVFIHVSHSRLPRVVSLPRLTEMA